MTSILNHPSVQLAGLILSGLFFLNQTRQRGIVLSLICMVAWLGIIVIVVDMIREPSQELSVIVSRRVEVIDEIELIQLGPIINTSTELIEMVTPNEQVQEAPQVVTSSWGSAQRSWIGISGNVARWQPNIYEAINHCGLVTPGYDTALLMAAIVTQESSGNPNAMGKAHDTGLGQVVNNSHPIFPNRPSRTELLDPQFNLNFAACLLRDNLNYTGTVEGAVNAYNGNGVHNGRTYAEIIFSHYNGFQPIVSAPVVSAPVNANANFGSLPVSGSPIITQNFHSGHPGLDIVRRVTA